VDSVLTKSLFFVLHLQRGGKSEVVVAFGHAEYRGKQREIIEAAVLGMSFYINARYLALKNGFIGADVFVLAPTGMGKVSILPYAQDYFHR
jgi:hypothetical protein